MHVFVCIPLCTHKHVCVRLCICGSVCTYISEALAVCLSVPPGSPIMDSREDVVSEGNETELTCTAMVSKPAASIRWMKGEQELTGQRNIFPSDILQIKPQPGSFNSPQHPTGNCKCSFYIQDLVSHSSQYAISTDLFKD